MMEITDVRALSKMAHDRNALVIVDNTFLSPYFQKPLTLGADIVVHSGTKFIGGHHDVISGFTTTIALSAPTTEFSKPCSIPAGESINT